MAKRSLNRRRRPRLRFGRRSLRASAAGPWIKIFALIALTVGSVFALYKYALPPALKLLNIEWPPATPAPPTPTPKPTPSPHPLAFREPTEIQYEIEIPSDMRFATDPMRYGDEILYTGGVDESNMQKNVRLMIYDINAKRSREQSSLPMENDDYFQPQMNENWIVYLDQKRSGGGYIRAFNRQTNQNFIVKQYYVGQPVITLNGDRVCWIERTGSYRDKVFLFELTTQENVCLETFDQAVFGQSAAHMSESEIVWAGYDINDLVANNDSIHGSIQYYRFDGENSSKPASYAPGTYVHNPKTNGIARAWIDTNGGPDATLYLSLNGGDKRTINTGVLGYGLGSNFLAYCKDQAMHVYLWEVEPQPIDVELSLKGERCIFSGVSDDAIFWFDTGVSQNDILKFAMPNELAPLSEADEEWMDDSQSEDETPSNAIPTIPPVQPTGHTEPEA